MTFILSPPVRGCAWVDVISPQERSEPCLLEPEFILTDALTHKTALGCAKHTAQFKKETPNFASSIEKL
jgi:hypothetical protein